MRRCWAGSISRRQALLCGAPDLRKRRRTTTHWSSFHPPPYFGAIPVNERVVVVGAWVFAAGVTAGIDGALRLAAELRVDEDAPAIELHMAYAPEPPFDSGTPETAPAAILEQAAIGAGHHGSARANGTSCRRQTRHRRSHR